MSESSIQASSAELDGLRQENELLLQQLHQVQEELEHYYLRYIEASAAAVAAPSSPVGAEPVFPSAPAVEPVLPSSVRMPAWEPDGPTERRLREKAEKLRDSILGSTSWGVTAPLRSLVARLTGRKIDQNLQPSTASRSGVGEYQARIRAERQVEALLDSTSWKLTTPLRWRGSGRTKALSYSGYLKQQLDFTRAEYQGTLDLVRQAAAAQESQMGQVQSLTEQIESLARQIETLQRQLHAATARLSESERQVKELTAEREMSEFSMAGLATERDAIVKERDELAKSRDAIVKERDELAQSRDAVVKERDELAQSRDAVVKERDELAQSREELAKKLTSVGDELEKLRAKMSERDYRQEVLDAEIIKAEAQIELIKELFLREPAAF